jgi:hypothetical protein
MRLRRRELRESVVVVVCPHSLKFAKRSYPKQLKYPHGLASKRQAADSVDHLAVSAGVNSISRSPSRDLSRTIATLHSGVPG